MSTHNIPIINIKKKITLNYPKYNNVCSYGIFFLGTQERVRNSRDKRAIGVRAIEVLLYSDKRPIEFFHDDAAVYRSPRTIHFISLYM